MSFIVSSHAKMPVTQAQKAQILLDLVSPWFVWQTTPPILPCVGDGHVLVAVCKWTETETQRLRRNMQQHTIVLETLRVYHTQIRLLDWRIEDRLYHEGVFRIGSQRFCATTDFTTTDGRFADHHLTKSLVVGRRATVRWIVGTWYIVTEATPQFGDGIWFHRVNAFRPGPTFFPHLYPNERLLSYHTSI